MENLGVEFVKDLRRITSREIELVMANHEDEDDQLRLAGADLLAVLALDILVPFLVSIAANISYDVVKELTNKKEKEEVLGRIANAPLKEPKALDFTKARSDTEDLLLAYGISKQEAGQIHTAIEARIRKEMKERQ